MLELSRVLVDPRAAAFNVRAAAFVSSYDASSGHVIGARGIVEYPRKRRDVRGVGTDDADFDGFSGLVGKNHKQG